MRNQERRGHGLLAEREVDIDSAMVDAASRSAATTDDPRGGGRARRSRTAPYFSLPRDLGADSPTTRLRAAVELASTSCAPTLRPSHEEAEVGDRHAAACATWPADGYPE